MNIKSFHTDEKPVSVNRIISAIDANVTALQILVGGILKEHSTTQHGLLICINGNVVFHNEKGETEAMQSGDIIIVPPNIKHWLEGITESQLILIK